MNWNEMFASVQKALERQGLRPSAHDFVRRLEANGLTILPLQARLDADVYGTAVITKTTGGYAVLDPASTLLVNTREKLGPQSTEKMVLVHVDCDGTPLEGLWCPKCRLYPDMQSTEHR